MAGVLLTICQSALTDLFLLRRELDAKLLTSASASITDALSIRCSQASGVVFHHSQRSATLLSDVQVIK